MGKENRYQNRTKVFRPDRQPKESPWNQSYREDDIDEQVKLLKVNHEVLRTPEGDSFDLQKAIVQLVKRDNKRNGLTNKYRN